ncbi:MAG: phosphoribosyltransferase family protein [Ectothiorhodospiraceae bacterium]|jgi:predicted phosphoribosyltransferase
MGYRDRAEAGARLAEMLHTLGLKRPLVLGIPRGGVPVAAEVARALDGELDIVLVHKLGAPGNPEFAVGAVNEHGEWFLDPRVAGWLSTETAAAEAGRQAQALRARRERYGRAPAAIAGRDVVVVDDGSATGATMAAALRLLKSQHPARLVAAVGVAPPDAISRLESEVADVVCPLVQRDFMAVGQFFRDFGQVDDATVMALLQRQE